VSSLSGSEGAGFFVTDTFLAAESGERTLVERGKIVQTIQEIFLEDLDQQGEPDFPTG
jgi:hypothetical protein